MNKRERNLQYMLNAVIQTMNTHNEVWADETRIGTIVDELETRFSNMESLLKEKLDLGVAYSAVKRDDWLKFGRKLVTLTGYLHDLAFQNNQLDKLLHLRLTEANFVKSSMQQAATMANSILNVSESMLDDLSGYSDGTALHEEVSTLYKNFVKTGLLPSQRRKRRAEVTAEIREQQDEIRQVLKGSLDMVMRRYQDTHREFYLEYTRSRVIPKFNGGKSSGSIEEPNTDATDIVDTGEDNNSPPANGDMI